MIPQRLATELEQWWTKQLGKDTTELIMHELQQPSYRALRSVSSNRNWIAPVTFQKVPWAYDCFYVNGQFKPGKDPYWHAGCYYMQEPSSMRLDEVWHDLYKKGFNFNWVLDGCAAPGGKTLGILATMSGTNVVANEISLTRAQILHENITRSGFAHRCIITRNHLSKLPTSIPFDAILIDAPCSGEGLFRKDIKAWEQWNPTLVRNCATRQGQILNDAWKLLAEDGVLIYTTCTLNTIENEGVLTSFLQDKEYEFIEIDALKNTFQLPGSHTYRCLLGVSGGEGLSITVLQKKSAQEVTAPKKLKDTFWKITTPSKQSKTYFDIPKQVSHISHVSTGNDFIFHAIRSIDIKMVMEFLEQSYPITAGQLMGNSKKAFYPSDESVFTFDFIHYIPKLELQDYIPYLQGKQIKEVVQNGLYHVAIDGNRIGFIKGMDGRWQNTYPKAWRRYAQ
jgi:16S rRNA C967 or C1407 C5-methylase (RsmB/RsmF family)